MSRLGTGLRVTISFTEPAGLTKLKIGLDLEVGSFKNEMPPLRNELGEKGPSSTCNLSRKVDIDIPQTSLAAMVVFLKPRCQRCRDSTILVTMAFWEADSRHASELSVFFFSEKTK